MTLFGNRTLAAPAAAVARPIRDCGHCEFFDRPTSTCRPHSPAIGPDGEAVWPTTSATGWCGEFKPRFREREGEP